MRQNYGFLDPRYLPSEFGEAAGSTRGGTPGYAGPIGPNRNVPAATGPAPAGGGPAPTTGPTTIQRTGPYTPPEIKPGRTPLGHRAPGQTGGSVFGPSTPGTPAPATGTESGPTYIEQRYLDRLNGTDPAFEYAKKRGMEALGNQYSAAGGFNSGAARQGESDFMANLIAQSQGQLDALAGGATGARQHKLDSMFNQGLGLAGGQAGTMGAYDLASARSNDALMEALIQMMGGKAGVDDKSRQGGINNILGFASLL